MAEYMVFVTYYDDNDELQVERIDCDTLAEAERVMRERRKWERTLTVRIMGEIDACAGDFS